MNPLHLAALPGNYTVHRFAADSPLPAKLLAAEVFHISRTPEELSVVCPSELCLDSQSQFGPLAGLRVSGQLDFALIGILAELTQRLATAGLSVFAVSSYDTDFLFFREEDYASAIDALEHAGHTVDCAPRPR
jgi:uncharacterized protein